MPTYPTRSLDFLNATEKSNEPASHVEETSAAVRLRVVIVGAGLGGLATAIALARKGHSVEVLEQARQIGEVMSTAELTNDEADLAQGWRWHPDSAQLQPHSARMGSGQIPWRPSCGA